MRLRAHTRSLKRRLSRRAQAAHDEAVAHSSNEAEESDEEALAMDEQAEAELQQLAALGLPLAFGSGAAEPTRRGGGRSGRGDKAPRCVRCVSVLAHAVTDVPSAALPRVRQRRL